MTISFRRTCLGAAVLGLLVVAVLGGVLAKLGEGFWEQLWVLARRALSI